MRQRVLSALVGLLVLVAVLILFETIVLDFVVGAIVFVAVMELMKATKLTSYKALTALCGASSLIICFFRPDSTRIFLLILFGFVVAAFLILFKQHDTLRIEQVSLAFFIGIIVPVFFVGLVSFRDLYGVGPGLFYVLVSLGAAWLCDTCAYFTGYLMGKHKLAPRISPKKTIEGAVGGIVLSTPFMLLLAFFFQNIMRLMGFSLQIYYMRLMLVFPLFCLAGMAGDLAMSVIKRQYQVKDYGKIMPGHGGIMDRFDSVLFVVPLVYIICDLLPLVVSI